MRVVEEARTSVREGEGLGLVGEKMLGGGDPARVLYSVTLYERGPGQNRVRVQTDNLDQPLDINGGAMDLGQVFRRPAARLVPWSTPLEGVYLCSASTPPGGGVHGMCGYHAARAALRNLR